MYIICNLLKKNIAGVQSEPAVPATGVWVWLGFEIANPDPDPSKNPDQTRRVRRTRDNIYAVMVCAQVQCHRLQVGNIYVTRSVTRA